MLSYDDDVDLHVLAYLCSYVFKYHFEKAEVMSTVELNETSASESILTEAVTCIYTLMIAQHACMCQKTP